MSTGKWVRGRARGKMEGFVVEAGRDRRGRDSWGEGRGGMGERGSGEGQGDKKEG